MLYCTTVLILAFFKYDQSVRGCHLDIQHGDGQVQVSKEKEIEGGKPNEHNIATTRYALPRDHELGISLTT